MIIETGGRSIIFGKRLFSSSAFINVEERDSQVIIDMFVDLFFLMYPLAIIYPIYQILLQPRETLLMIFAPSISLFSKLRFMLKQNISRNMNEVLHLLQTNESRKRGRSRSS